MKVFWPNRSKAKGFSIQKLASKYLLEISSSGSNVCSNEISDQVIDDINLKSLKEGDKKNSIIDISIKRTHWANRDFSEYKEAA